MSDGARRARGGAKKSSNKPNGAKPEANIPGLAARRAAARLLAAVIDAKTSLDGLTDHDNGHPMFLALDMRDRGLVRAILTTALRYRLTIEALITARLDRALPGNAHSLSHILHVAAAQMLFLDVPDTAAVNLAVEHAKADPRTARFAALVNGVLREISRRKERALPAALAKTIDTPDWFFDRLVAAYGEDEAKAIAAAHRTEAPIDLTVKGDPSVWAEKLGGFVLPTGSVRLENPEGSVTQLEGFAEGEWWVQDAAAAIPAQMLGDLAGLRVADLCAAPGGKTAQLALAGADVTALEINPNRAKRLAANLERLKLKAEIIVTDLFDFDQAEKFDAILLDAPCSSTGTVRRHPDVPWTKGMQDIEKLAGLQARMLAKAITLLKPGGKIVFSNCSLDALEGESLLEAFLATNPNVAADPVLPEELPYAPAFLTRHGALRTTPSGFDYETPARSGLDGFFAARLRLR